MPEQGNDNPTPPTTGQPTTKKILTPSGETKPAKQKKGKKDKPEPTTAGGKLWHNWVKPIGSVVLVVVLLRSTLIDWNDVPTGSMEPEIHVGDRIAVNRLAYALQAPLSGPTIDVPFFGRIADNPLDGIPQWQWGKPDRGDIVTFWNPITKVRMVKRIVAIPGDTIAMSGGKMTINGTTATYKPINATAAGLPTQTKWQVANPLGGTMFQKENLEYQEESLLGETRIIQHIKNRWLDNAQLVELSNGNRATLSNGIVRVLDFTASSDMSRARSEPMQLTEYINKNPKPKVIAQVRDGVIYINDKEASLNDFTRAILSDLREGPSAEILAKADLAIDSDHLLHNGVPVSMDAFENQIKAHARAWTDRERQHANLVMQSLALVGNLTMTSFGPITVGDNQYFMVGDNRNNSHDGRRFGTIDRGEITGEAFAVAFSFKDNKMFALPPKPAWSRFFKDLD